MTCKNCGAEYPDESSCCTHCGTENFIISKKKKEEKFQELHNETVEIRKLPKKIVKKSSKLLWKIAISVSILIIIIFCFTYIGTLLNEKQKASNRNTYISELETLYQSKSYNELYHYLKEKSLWQDIYLKYIQVGDSYYYYQEVLDILEDNKILSGDNIYDLLKYGCKSIRISKMAYEDNVPLDNEDVLTTIYDQMEDILITVCKLTLEEIHELQILQELDKKTLLPYQKRIKERI